MVEKITTKPIAEDELNDILIYLSTNWGKKSVRKFLFNLRSFYKTLETQPQIGHLEFLNREFEIRSYPITKQILVIYEIRFQNIVILKIFDVRQHPDKKYKNIKI